MSGLKNRSEIIKKYYDDCTSSDSITISSDTTGISADGWTQISTPTYQEPIVNIPSVWTEPIQGLKGLYDKCKGGDENMRYLYEVILVNPKNDNYSIEHVVAKTEVSALIKAYDGWKIMKDLPPMFDDLKTSCRVLMEWKKEKSLKKAIETIKEAVE